MKTSITVTTILGLALLAGLSLSRMPAQAESTATMQDKTAMLQQATFAGGCFWCMEKPFEKLDGVNSVISGYTGGQTGDPNYSNYGSGGHIEAVQIEFDPAKISYEKLLDVYWHQVNPTDAGGQFVDRGHAYTTAIFYHNEEQRTLAEASKKGLEASNIFGAPIVTPILPAAMFYPAEEYHQDYYKKNPLRYTFYRSRSGRDDYLKSIDWSKLEQQQQLARPDDVKARLTPLQYKVTQQEGTEPPFKNEYWDNKKEGIYVDIVSDEPLFSSIDKYDSKTGWPSFTKPLVANNITEKEDRTFFTVRTEVRSKEADSHLGHVFDDGPAPTGLRYCINSAALRFIPKEALAKEGYERFLPLFKQ